MNPTKVALFHRILWIRFRKVFTLWKSLSWRKDQLRRWDNGTYKTLFENSQKKQNSRVIFFSEILLYADVYVTDVSQHSTDVERLKIRQMNFSLCLIIINFDRICAQFNAWTQQTAKVMPVILTECNIFCNTFHWIIQCWCNENVWRNHCF